MGTESAEEVNIRLLEIPDDVTLTRYAKEQLTGHNAVVSIRYSCKGLNNYWGLKIEIAVPISLIKNKAQLKSDFALFLANRMMRNRNLMSLNVYYGT